MTYRKPFRARSRRPVSLRARLIVEGYNDKQIKAFLNMGSTPKSDL